MSPRNEALEPAPVVVTPTFVTPPSSDDEYEEMEKQLEQLLDQESCDPRDVHELELAMATYDEDESGTGKKVQAVKSNKAKTESPHHPFKDSTRS